MKIEKSFYFLAGIPRSGSTVLQAVLSQNPLIHVSATSPLLDLLLSTQQAWNKIPQSVASGSSQQLSNVQIGMMNGLYAHINKPIIVDKHRAWARNVKSMGRFVSNFKCICTVRPIPEVLASFITLIEKQPNNNYVDRELIKNQHTLTTKNRVEVLWNSFIHNPWESLKIGYENNKENLLLIPYSDLVTNPMQQLQKIYQFLSLPEFTHDFNNIICSTPENDNVWGLAGLHDIRPTLQSHSKLPETVLGNEIYEKYKTMKLEFWQQ